MWSITGWIEVHDGHPWDREPEREWPEPEPERAATIVATQDVEGEIREGRRRRNLAGAAGSRWTGLKHIELEPGTLSGPPHWRGLGVIGRIEQLDFIEQLDYWDGEELE